jgi:MFS family permease
MPTTTNTLSRRAAWLGFIVVLAASVMDLLDSTIAQTAAPAIRHDLGGSYAAIEWISAAYTLAMAVTLMLGSRLAVVLGFIGAMGGMMIALNVMFQTGLGLTPLACAVATVAIPVTAIAGSITSSALLAKIGRTTMHIGIVVMAIGLIVVDLVMRSAGGGVTAWDLAGPLAITGFGMGMVFVPMFDVILAGVAPHELGSASGLLESIQQLAMSIGIAAVGTVLFDSVGHARSAVAFVGASDHALLMAVAFLVAACAAVFWLPKHARAAPAA